MSDLVTKMQKCDLSFGHSGYKSGLGTLDSLEDIIHPLMIIWLFKVYKDPAKMRRRMINNKCTCFICPSESLNAAACPVESRWMKTVV